MQSQKGVVARTLRAPGEPWTLPQVSEVLTPQHLRPLPPYPKSALTPTPPYQAAAESDPEPNRSNLMDHLPGPRRKLFLLPFSLTPPFHLPPRWGTGRREPRGEQKAGRCSSSRGVASPVRPSLLCHSQQEPTDEAEGVARRAERPVPGGRWVGAILHTTM